MTNSQWLRSLSDNDLCDYIYSVYLAGKLIAKKQTQQLIITDVEFVNMQEWLVEEHSTFNDY